MSPCFIFQVDEESNFFVRLSFYESFKWVCFKQFPKVNRNNGQSLGEICEYVKKNHLGSIALIQTSLFPNVYQDLFTQFKEQGSMCKINVDIQNGELDQLSAYQQVWKCLRKRGLKLKLSQKKMDYSDANEIQNQFRSFIEVKQL